MSNGIHTYSDLLKEKQRLEELIVLQKARIKDDFTALKEELRPVNVGFNFIKDLVTRDRNNPLLNFAVGFFTRIVLKKTLLARSNWFVRKIVTFLFQNYASHIFRERADRLLYRILSLVKPAKRHTKNLPY